MSRPTTTVSNSLTIPVGAGSHELRRALHRLDLAAPAVRALRAIGLRVAVRPGGLSWRPERIDGHVDVDVDVRVQPDSLNSSFLSITTRFRATDDRARAQLLDAWAVVGPLADDLTRRAARTVKDDAEDDRFEDHYRWP